MRDVLIHDYIGVDLDEVWNIASFRIPELQAVLEQFLAGERPGSASAPSRPVEYGPRLFLLQRLSYFPCDCISLPSIAAISASRVW